MRASGARLQRAGKAKQWQRRSVGTSTTTNASTAQAWMTTKFKTRTKQDETLEMRNRENVSHPPTTKKQKQGILKQKRQRRRVKTGARLKKSLREDGCCAEVASTTKKKAESESEEG